MARGKKYEPADVERGLQALAEYGSSEKASEITGIPPSTLRTWKVQQPDEFDEYRREKRIPHIDKAWEGARLALDCLIKQLPEMKGKDLAVTYGILVDKALIMGGEPSEITERRARPTIYLPEIDEPDMEAEPGTSREVSPEPGV